MTLNNKTILVVDDDSDIRQELCEALEELGANVIQAINGKEAFRLFQAQKVDAVISDLRMPGGDGVELVQKLKAISASVPFFLITGFSDYSGKELKVLGVSAVVFKPFDIEELLAMVGQKLASPLN